jgi:hypothetical protein
MKNPLLIISTNRKNQEPELKCQAFFNFEGIRCMQVHNVKPNRYILDLHNGFIDTEAMVINVSENVFVFDIEALFNLVTRLVLEGIECTGLPEADKQPVISDVFNILLPKTAITGKNYFAQMHQLNKDSFIRFGVERGCPGILLYNQAGVPFGIYAGSIKYFKSPTPDFLACYQYAIQKNNERIERIKSLELA